MYLPAALRQLRMETVAKYVALLYGCLFFLYVVLVGSNHVCYVSLHLFVLSLATLA